MKLFNSLTRNVEPLTPLSGSTVNMYTCGLTVYSQPHIGNWQGYIYWDVLTRALQSEGYQVQRTQNITDVGHLTSDADQGEDKMEKGARLEGSTAWDVAKKYSDVAEYEAYSLLGLLRPTHLVRATDYIAEQIAFAQELELKGHTYVIEGEGLYFDSSTFPSYGQLARLDIDGLQAGKRVAASGKRNATDFALWKQSPVDSSRDMEWESPWGVGFPGWHLECSVIAKETLGTQIDIHTGGIDHIPIHHTNEIAQTESLTGVPFSQFWIHNNHIKSGGTKIAKSLGNVVTLQDLIDKGYDLNAFKLLTLSKRYRTEGNFDWTIMEAAQHRFDNWRAVAVLRHQTHSSVRPTDAQLSVRPTLQLIRNALSDDLDTPSALAAIEDAFGRIQATNLEAIDRSSLILLLEEINSLLGIDLLSSTPDITDEDKQLLLRRQRARENEDWQASDTIRDELAARGIQSKDGPHGTIWLYK